jgi:hypothetical protein
MKNRKDWIRKQIASSLVLVLMAPLAEGAAASPGRALGGLQESAPTAQAAAKVPGSSARNQGDDSARPVETYPDSPAPKPSQAANQGTQQGTSQADSGVQQNSAPKPLGTAVAPEMKTTGVAGSRPAGAAIAPAKQRRARSLLIRMGVVVGAAVAIGTVVALSRSSPSRPN